MNGVAAPIVTPFTESGDIDEEALRNLVGWLEDREVDFHVPCGSTSEAELMTLEERRSVTEIVVEEASLPVLAGAGHPGYRETIEQIEGATTAGAECVMIVTPFYYPHSQEALAEYYREVADAASVPVYLYSVPPFTDVILEPETVGQLADHPNIAGMKDSLGDLGAFIRTAQQTSDADFDLLTGSANLLKAARDHGGTGAILALANLAPEEAKEGFEASDESDRVDMGTLVELNRAITSSFGIPGLKWAMRERGAPSGYPRRPFRAPSEHAKSELSSLLGRANLI